MAQTGYTPLLIYASGTASNVPSAANLTSSASGAELALNYADGKLYFKNSSGVVTLLASSAGASGDVVGPASATDNALARFDLTTGKLIQNSVGILSDAGVLTGLTGLTSSGNITLSALTSGRVPYASTGGLLVDSANLLFDGTTLTANALTTTSTVTINGGTANGVAYLNGSKVLTTGSALTFDGTNFQVGGNSQPIIRAVSSSTNNATARLFTDGDTVYVGSANTSTTGGSVPVVFQIGGSEQMRLTSTGLGIGVSSPGQKLSVSDSAGLISNFNSTNASGVYIRFQNSGTSIGDIGSGAQIVGGSAGDFGLTSRAGSLIFGQNSAEGMRLTSTGLGIGTSSPAYKLQVGDGSADTRALFLSNNNFSMGVGRSTGTIGKWLGSPSSNVLTFSGNDGTEQMRLDSSGNLGIGTNTIPTVGSTTVLAVGNSSGGTLGIVQSGSIAYRISASTSGVDCFNPNSSPISWYTNGTERMRLDASGNLGIGTSSPAYKLDVSGSAFASNWYGPQTAFTVGTVGGGVGLIGYGSTGVGGLTNTLLFQANGEKMRLDSSGNLGIGTSSITPVGSQTVLAVGNSSGGTVAHYQSGSLAYRTSASSSGVDCFNPNATPIQWYTSGTSRMLLDSSGNLGLGVTPSAWQSGSAIQMAGGQGYSRFGVTNNAYYDGSNYRYVSTAQATLYGNLSGSHLWFNAPSGTAGNAITFTQAMTLDASGNLLVGNTSSTGFRAQIYGNGLSFASAGGYAGYIGQANIFMSTGAATDFAIRSDANLLFGSNGATERARITSGGDFYINTTGAGGKFYVVSDLTANNALRADAPASFTSNVAALICGTAAGTGFNFLYCESSGGSNRLNIRGDGNVYNANGTYGTISDVRLKQDISDAPSQWDDIKAVRFRKYRMKEDVALDENAPYLLGVVAQELEQTSPGLVDDGEVKTVKSSILLMKAAVALQEAMARIETLEAEVAALKGA
jgi:hypothetical protein